MDGDVMERIELTDEQVLNWRNSLVLSFGAYALIMPREDIERLAGNMQKASDDMAEALEEEES
jgi:hypothetical protein